MTIIPQLNPEFHRQQILAKINHNNVNITKMTKEQLFEALFCCYCRLMESRNTVMEQSEQLSKLYWERDQ